MADSRQAGLESVRDYPTPPRLERTSRHLRVEFAGDVIAESRNGYRILQTNRPPIYLFPPDDVRREFLVPDSHRKKHEWLGEAVLLSLRVGRYFSEQAALLYANPEPAYIAIRDCVAFYAGRVDRCYVNSERVVAATPGMVGWITRDLIIPIPGMND